MVTTMVESTSSLYRRKPFSFGSQGHEHFCSSTFTSLKKFLTLVIIASLRDSFSHTPGGTRTPNRRFWRPLLYQLSYWRIFNLPPRVVFLFLTFTSTLLNA